MSQNDKFPGSLRLFHPDARGNVIYPDYSNAVGTCPVSPEAVRAEHQAATASSATSPAYMRLATPTVHPLLFVVKSPCTGVATVAIYI